MPPATVAPDSKQGPALKTVQVAATPLVDFRKEFVSRERTADDLMNTGVAAALIGGFALGNLSHGLKNGVVYYILSCIAVHGCTCASLSSALLFMVVNRMHDEPEAIAAYKKKRWWLLLVPIAKFIMGVFAYLTSVVLLSWQALASEPGPQIIVLLIGVMSLSMIVLTMGIVVYDLPRTKKKKQ